MSDPERSSLVASTEHSQETHSGQSTNTSYADHASHSSTNQPNQPYQPNQPNHQHHHQHHSYSHGHSHSHHRSHSHSHSARQRSSSISGGGGDRHHRRHHHHHSSKHATSGHPTAKTTAMHDDTDAGRLIPVNRPAFAVDYLCSSWQNEDDIAASWKYMTKQKHDMINGLRLENASWRNWAKQRHRLKTISPKALNWLKDSDTTWLYGPLYKAAIDEFDLSRFGTRTMPTGTISIPSTPTRGVSPAGSFNGKYLKPALKHKTASELFKADTLFHVQSDLKLARRIEPYSKAIESAVFKEHRQPKLTFNDSVEQCVAVDSDAISEDEDYVRDNAGRRAIDTNGKGPEDEDSGLLIRISARHTISSIVRIGPTRLKAGSSYGLEPDDDEDEDFEDEEEDYDEDYDEEYDEEEDYEEEEGEEEEEEMVVEDEEEGLYDEPIYLGNAYTGSETGYTGMRHYAPRSGPEFEYADQADEAAIGEVSYTRPSPPSPPSAASTIQVRQGGGYQQSLSDFEVQRPCVPVAVERPSISVAAERPSVSVAAVAPSVATVATTTTTTSAITRASPLRTPARIPTPTMVDVDMRAVPMRFQGRGMGADKKQTANIGIQQRTVDLVANVRDLVSWASSLVFNSNTF